MTTMITMFDDTNIALIPGSPEAVAGYVDGSFANYDALVAKFPKAKHLPITVFGGRATCLDVETGDATIASIFAWFKVEEAAGTWRPVIYSSVSNMDAIVNTMTANGFKRSSYRLWSAHYDAGAHICGPATCKFTSAFCDGTQWTSTARGESLDQSELAADFFGGSKPPPPKGPFRHEVGLGCDESLAKLAANRNTTVDAIVALTNANAGDGSKAILAGYLAFDTILVGNGAPHPVMPAKFVYYTEHE